jgi:hypothetical protein
MDAEIPLFEKRAYGSGDGLRKQQAKMAARECQ